MIAMQEGLQIPVRDWYEKLRQTQELPVAVKDFLQKMEEKHPPTYEHMLRVGRLCWNIAQFTGNDAPGLRLAGLCHDLGKLKMTMDLLEKPCKEWTPEDGISMQRHVTEGYAMLLPVSPFTAHIVLRHHRFQKDPYPTRLPPLPSHCSIFEEEIEILASLLATADCYDAKWRGNQKYGHPAPSKIKKEMPLCRPHHADLIEKLYNVGIFTESTPF